MIGTGRDLSVHRQLLRRIAYALLIVFYPGEIDNEILM